MNDSGSSSLGSRLRRFLSDPASNFIPSYRICYTKAVIYLGLQKSRGRILPESGSDGSRALEDLAHQLLERFFLDSKPPHFRKILHYFGSQSLADINTISDEQLESTFLPFFYQQLRQGLSREQKWVHPEKSARQKTIENILRGEEYEAVPDFPECVVPREFHSSLRPQCLPVSKELLEQIAWESALNSHTTTELCREFFRRLSQETEFRNFVGRKDLKYALTRAIERLAFEISPIGSQFPTPEEDRQARSAEIAADRALVRIQDKELADLIGSNVLSSEEAIWLASSCRLYLVDRSSGNGTDKLAAYFRAGFPEDYHPQYEKMYKHRFLKIMGLAEQYYTEELDDLL